MTRDTITMRAKPSKAWIWAGGLTVLVLALQIAGFHNLRHDDAYITYRYGQNLAEGRVPNNPQPDVKLIGYESAKRYG